MANPLITLISKEVKELLRDPKILIGIIVMPLILFPAMGSAIGISQRAVSRAVRRMAIAVYNEDGGSASQELMEFLSKDNDVYIIEAENLHDALKRFMEAESSILLYIPDGYSERMISGERCMLRIYVHLRRLNMAETGKASSVEQLLTIYGEECSLRRIRRILEEAGEELQPEAVRRPISISYASILKGVVLDVPPGAIFGIIMSQNIMLPVMIMMMNVFAVQMAATSIALEKEQKTLETLMTLPIGRMTILTGKLFGSILIAIAGAVSYMIGFSYYMRSTLGFIPQLTIETLKEAGLRLSPLGLTLLGAIIFLTLLLSLALSLSIAVFAEDVRGAQSLVGLIYIPIMMPSIILMFTDVDMLPAGLRWLMLIIPYTHTVIASKALFLGRYTPVLLAVAYMLVFTTITLYITTRIFSTERIITARIRRWRLRHGG